ncbi:C-GCAxxG-C-C family (seleno)protein [Natronoflexus pectinivorans]|uniref:Putative redox-active protein with C_GCAxxG_C_C motif n=1 Tax=Natronoflexus pectinivorans TaxID=682526 RepID=A0A4R2GIP0_9BACT|nr:C-GCAxxG-C-C family (seleno)protein [Natronoflexus pectinivorans]TCO08388.1 putative redox-active protein with C_GCAxxG_C_C motif [Natronoflexus pectinivorans]
MNRRRAIKASLGTLTGGAVGLFALSRLFKPDYQANNDPFKVEYIQAGDSWDYEILDPQTTANIAYEQYSNGSCMYAVVGSVVMQLAEKYGEPYRSFPLHLFRYGHGGIGGYGSICGALNGAAAVLGLFVSERNVRDRIVTDIFQWYEQTPLPVFIPKIPAHDFILPAFSTDSVLCHVSNTSWSKKAGVKVDSNERKERCRRLSCDVTAKVVTALNEIKAGNYVGNKYANESANSCVACHGKTGKLDNSFGQMDCNSCHHESIGHRAFSNIHYKLLPK